MYRLLYGLGLLALAACEGSYPAYKSLQFSESVSHANDVVFQKEVRRVREELGSLTPKGRLLRGMTISDGRCDLFFEDLEKLRTNVGYAGRRFSSLQAGLAPLLNVAGASSLALSAVPAALGFISGSVSDFEELYLLSKFRGAVYKKWQIARVLSESELLKLMKDEQGVLNTDTLDEKEKYEWINREIYKYSRLCLRTQLINWLDQAANSGQLAVVDVVPASPPETPPVVIQSPAIPATGERTDLEKNTVPTFIVTN